MVKLGFCVLAIKASCWSRGRPDLSVQNSILCSVDGNTTSENRIKYKLSLHVDMKGQTMKKELIVLPPLEAVEVTEENLQQVADR